MTFIRLTTAHWIRLIMLCTELITGTVQAQTLSETTQRSVTDNDLKEISLLKERLEAMMDMPSEDADKNSAVKVYPDKSGKWADIDYSLNINSLWPSGKHWDRINQMIKKVRSASGNEASILKEHIVNAVDYWLRTRPENRNYWWNAIGIPNKMGQALILDKNIFSQSQIKEMLQLIRLGVKEDFYEYHGKATGQNLIWLASIHMIIGIMEKDTAALKRAFTNFYDEVALNPKEGIQYDYSFHQHGAQLYAGGYGMGFSADVAKLINLAEGTSYQFPEDKTTIFSSYVLDGTQWMFRGPNMDFSTWGREISRREDYYNRANSIIAVCSLLSAANLPRKNEFEQVKLRIEGKGSPLTGNKHFWESDYMVHHTNAYFSSVKMASPRIKASESGNNENLKAYYLGHGIHSVFRRGDEYKEIFPVWDWQRLPGHLAEQKTTANPLFIWGTGAQGKKSFVGGVSDGVNGMAVNDYLWDSVQAKRAWFFLGAEMVCLGNSIYSFSDNPVFQSVNQCLLKGDVVINGKKGKPSLLTSGQKTIPGLKWVHHDSIAYFFPSADAVTIKNEPQTGSWNEINGAYSNEKLSMDVFSAWMDFGKNVKNKNYHYIIVPGISSGDASRYKPVSRVIRNDSLLQAVTHPGIKTTMAAFYKPGELSAPGKLKITASKPLLLLLLETDTGFALHLSNPENKKMEATLTISRKVECDNCSWSETDKTTSIFVSFPSGNYAGQTIKMALKEN